MSTIGKEVAIVECFHFMAYIAWLTLLFSDYRSTTRMDAFSSSSRLITKAGASSMKNHVEEERYDGRTLLATSRLRNLLLNTQRYHWPGVVPNVGWNMYGGC